MAFDSEILHEPNTEEVLYVLPLPKSSSFASLLSYLDQRMEPPLRDGIILDVSILKAARARLERGWCQRAVFDSNGGVCAMGAMLSAIQGREVPNDHNLRDEQRLDTLSRYFPHCRGMGDVIRINDDRCTTKRDMLMLFDRAIATAREALLA